MIGYRRIGRLYQRLPFRESHHGGRHRFKTNRNNVGALPYLWKPINDFICLEPGGVRVVINDIQRPKGAQRRNGAADSDNSNFRSIAHFSLKRGRGPRSPVSVQISSTSRPIHEPSGETPSRLLTIIGPSCSWTAITL